MKVAIKKPDAERSVNKSFVNAANSSAENTEPEMRGDEEVVMSSWAKEERLMKWFECLEVEKGKIWTHNQRPWNQMQSYSTSVHLDWFKLSVCMGRHLQWAKKCIWRISLSLFNSFTFNILFISNTNFFWSDNVEHVTAISAKEQREAQGQQFLYTYYIDNVTKMTGADTKGSKFSVCYISHWSAVPPTH